MARYWRKAPNSRPICALIASFIFWLISMECLLTGGWGPTLESPTSIHVCLHLRSPPCLDPPEGAGIRRRFAEPSQEGAQLTCVVLHVPDVVDMQLASGRRYPGEPGGAFERFTRLGGKDLVRLLPANRHVGDCLVLGQTRAWSGVKPVVATSLVQGAQLEGLLVR